LVADYNPNFYLFQARPPERHGSSNRDSNTTLIINFFTKHLPKIIDSLAAILFHLHTNRPKNTKPPQAPPLKTYGINKKQRLIG
jgi:hypothetical protein